MRCVLLTVVESQTSITWMTGRPSGLGSRPVPARLGASAKIQLTTRSYAARRNGGATWKAAPAAIRPPLPPSSPERANPATEKSSQEHRRDDDRKAPEQPAIERVRGQRIGDGDQRVGFQKVVAI